LNDINQNDLTEPKNEALDTLPNEINFEALDFFVPMDELLNELNVKKDELVGLLSEIDESSCDDPTFEDFDNDFDQFLHDDIIDNENQFSLFTTCEG